MQQISTSKKWVLSAAIALAFAASLPAHGAASAVSAVAVRTTTPLMQNWKFIQDDALTDAAALAASGGAWTTVSLPHTWNAKDAASIEETTPQSKKYKRGRGWYRLEFNNAGKGATQWLQFDGASIVADVWLNGKKLGQHKGAFTTFRFDISDKLQPGKNVLLVKTDNTAPQTATDLTAIAPLTGDFNMSGGLYRDVMLVATPDAVHFALDDFGSSGVFARTTSIANGNAVVNVRAKLKNDSSSGAQRIVQAALLDRAGKVVRVAQQRVTLAAGAALEVTQDLNVAKAHLWQGVDDPYLYTLVVELKNDAGATLDKVTHDYGIREMKFDADKGFFLNGKSMPLHGVSLHQDYINKGWALSKTDIDTSLGLIKELGANTVRLAHYPHSRYTLERADRLGFVIWAEVPYVDRTLTNEYFGMGGDAADCLKTSEVPASFATNLKQQLQELMRQQYNHASVGMWSLANEIGNGGLCMGKDTVTPLMRELNTLAHAEDPSRVTTQADSVEVSAIPGWPSLPTGGITDTWALNRYYMWYYERGAEGLGKTLDEMRLKYPRQPIGVSEYGMGSALTHHTDNPLGGLVGSFDTSGKTRTVYQPEGYANFGHEQNYAQMVAREYVWGTYVWNMFDFGSGIRHEGDIGGTNTKGLVTFDRKTRKDAFFFYKANWSKAPVTYVTARRYTERAYAVTDVKVYSNADTLQLKVNGAVIGSLRADQCVLKACEFKGVVLKPGKNSIVAEGKHAGKTVIDTVSWNLSDDNARNVYIIAGQPATGFVSASGHRHGSDNFFRGGLGYPLVEDGIGFFAGKAKFNTKVTNVSDPKDAMLWASVRLAPQGYDIPLANGEYRVTLGFLEPEVAAKAGSRVFSVEANGVRQIDSFDIVQAAGAHSTAVTRSFNVAVRDGKLKLDFKPQVGEAVISNIAVVRQ